MAFYSLMDILKVTHGSFNTMLALVFLYQAWLGVIVRRGRLGGEPRFDAVRRHRRLGPWLVAMGIAGYLFGLVLAYLGKERVAAHPLHFAVGSVMVVFLLGQYGLSRKIRGPGPSWRAPHIVLGANILCLYLVQIVIGFEILL